MVENIVFIDADSLAFLSSKEELEASKLDLDNRIVSIQSTCKASKFVLFLSKKANYGYFRNLIYPDYKKGRSTELLFIEELKQYMRDKYIALEIQSIEADDLLPIYRNILYSETPGTHNVIFASTDKDVAKTLSGVHYDFNKGEWITTSSTEATFYFLRQLVIGDSADNIKGIPGKGEKAADKLVTTDVKESLLKIFETYIDVTINKQQGTVVDGIDAFYQNFKSLYLLKNKDEVLKTVGDVHFPNINNHINNNPLINLTEW